MIDQYTGAIKYDGFSKASVFSEAKAKIVLAARKRMFNTFMDKMSPSKDDKIIDSGVAPVRGIKGAKTVTNNYFERLYPFTSNITATSIEDASSIETEFPGVKFVLTEPYATPFADREFDILFSNAVVEHVGDRDHQKQFIKEYCRISKKFFFTTPNRFFLFEPHSALILVHWLPTKYFHAILKAIGGARAGLADENILNLLDAKSFLSLFPAGTKCHLYRVKTFGMTSNLVVYGEWE